METVEQLLPLSLEEIHTIAELVFERHGRDSTLSNKAFGYIRETMLELGYTEEQFVARRLDVSREILKIRRDS